MGAAIIKYFVADKYIELKPCRPLEFTSICIAGNFQGIIRGADPIHDIEIASMYYTCRYTVHSKNYFLDITNGQISEIYRAPRVVCCPKLSVLKQFLKSCTSKKQQLI